MAVQWFNLISWITSNIFSLGVGCAGLVYSYKKIKEVKRKQ